jgi:recombination associated protein RdgC
MTEDRYAEAVEVVRQARKPSCSYIQRKLLVGFNEAARYIERMEAERLVSKAGRAGMREWLGDAA